MLRRGFAFDMREADEDELRDVPANRSFEEVAHVFNVGDREEAFGMRCKQDTCKVHNAIAGLACSEQ